KPIHGGDGGLATRKPLQRLDMGFYPLMILQRFAHVCDQHLGGRGQAQAARISFSSARICGLIAEEATFSRDAALRMEPSRATSSRYFNSRECNMAATLATGGSSSQDRAMSAGATGRPPH